MALPPGAVVVVAACVRHEFDYLSGWCRRCARVRDDGAEMDYAGTIRRQGPTYTAAEIDELRNRADSILARRYAREGRL